MVLDFIDAGQYFDPLRFGFEIAYSIVIMSLFYFIYYKASKMSALTSHEGIKYFKLAFLFFTLAYFTRLIHHLVRLLTFTTDINITGSTLAMSSLIVITYFSSLAIGYLIYSNLWKEINHKEFLAITHLFILITLTVFMINYSIWFLVIVQIMLMTILILISKKKIRYVYALISLFWIINLIIVYSRRFIIFEVKIILQIISLAIILYFIYKMLKWIR